MSREEVTRVVLDYFEGWFDGDVARMRNALHPELTKRSLGPDESGAATLRTTTAQRMLDLTASGEGTREDPGERRIEVDVEDLHETIANVTVRSAVYREYLGLVRTDDGWKIVNALWERS